MTQPLQQQIAAELTAASDTVQRILNLLPQIDDAAPNEHLIAAMAGYVATLYRAIERTLECILDAEGVARPIGQSWHVQILTMFSEPRYSGLPLVLTQDIVEGINTLRAFRSRFLNIYAVRMRWDLLKPVANQACEVAPTFILNVQRYLQRDHDVTLGRSDQPKNEP